VSDTGRKRKHYVLTPAGRSELETRRSQWTVVAETLGKVWARVVGAFRTPVGAWA